ncbi:MAG: methyltransferase domain-containing protein [Nitrososphaerales archaeon]
MTSPEKALGIRIEAHRRFSKREINDWILAKISLKKGDKVLDVGCGNGKQLIPFGKTVGSSGLAFGIDVSQSLLDEAMMFAKHDRVDIQVKRCKMEQIRPCLGSTTFDVISSCFSLYYSKGVSQTVTDISNLLTDSGRFFVCGPMRGNNAELADLHQEVSDLPEDFMTHTEFLENQALPLLREGFRKVETSIFRNPIVFPDAESLLAYWRSYTLFVAGATTKFDYLVKRRFSEDGSFMTNKVVLGILALK